MMVTLRTLQLAITSVCLLAVVSEETGGGTDRPPLFDDFEVELCDIPCLNNGKCVAFDTDNDGVLDPQCLCNTTFQGDLCENPKTCSLACENGGKCSLGDAWWLYEADGNLSFLSELLYRCNFEGGDCKDFFGDFGERCDCPAGTNGALCENTCDLTCQNGGECFFWGSEELRCRCPNNFYGDQCENECSKGCLNNGICVASSDGSGGFEEQCICRSGFGGEQCETEITCPLSCQNEGVCKFSDMWWFEEDGENGEEDFLSEFIQSITERCTIRDLPISECLGSFLEEPQPYCQCPPNISGSFCEFSCDLECQNGSTCQFYSRQNTFCPCGEGFAGDLCQFECTKACVNGGVCNSDGTTEWCQCPPYFEGDLCETERECDKTCANDGKCEFLNGFREYNEKYFAECLRQPFLNCPGPEDIQRCTCTNGFVGSDCSQPCPCQNGGTCSTRYWGRKLEQDEENLNDQLYFEENEEAEDGAGYFCQCPFGYYGQDCQFKYDSENCELNCENGGYCQADFGWGEDDAFGGWEGEEEEEQNGNSSSNQNYYYYDNNGELQDGRQNNNQNQNNNQYNNNNGNDVAAPTQQPFEYCVCPNGFMGRSCETQIDACNNQCKNGGVCTTDTVNTQDIGNRALQGTSTRPPTHRPTPAPTRPGMFAPSPDAADLPKSGSCSCLDGYSGESCERKACGSGYCSHGGSCIELPSGQTTSAGDNYVCDCSTSFLEGTVGIGRNCDTIVQDTCPWANSKMNPNEPWTCGGYGRCYKEEGQTSTPQCSCGTEIYTGPRCEFDITNPKDVAWSECSLECSNDGICLKGAVKPIAEIFIPFIEGTKKSGLFDYQTPDFEYCYCPDGFFGVQCDKQYEICGNRDHICFHGSKCKNDGGDWGCDCAGTESAGLYCQYKATDDCGDSNSETFCTNEATCTLDSSSNAVCACSEGWEGSKCETEVKLATTSGGDGEWSSATFAGTFVTILSVAMLSVALVIL